MWNLLQDELGGGVWPRLLVALLDTGVKGLFLMAAAGLAAVALRRKAAAARHLVWMLALGGLLLLPVVSLLVPKWTLPLLPALEAPAPLVAPVVPSPVPVANATAPEIAPIPANDTAPPVPVATSAATPLPPTPTSATVTIPAPSSPPYAAWILATWLTVTLLSLAPFVAGMVAVSRMRRRATTFADHDLQSLAAELAHSLGLKRPARLRCGPRGSMPMATGFLRPAVFLPADALAWSEEKRRVVLLHELAHVKRRDCLAHAIARTAVSFHWFNPLVWIALRQLRIEREHACDDLVLAAGERPSAYAKNLLEIARTLRASTVVSAAAITMAQKSQLEVRLLAVLDVARNRGRVTKRLCMTILATMLAALMIVSPLEVTRAREVSVPAYAKGNWRADGKTVAINGVSLNLSLSLELDDRGRIVGHLGDASISDAQIAAWTALDSLEHHQDFDHKIEGHLKGFLDGTLYDGSVLIGLVDQDDHWLARPFIVDPSGGSQMMFGLSHYMMESSQTLHFAGGVVAQLQERDFAVTYSTGHKAQVVAIGNDGEGQYGDAWGPDGALLSAIPELFKKTYNDRSSGEGEYRRLLIEIVPAGTDTDISVAWRLDGSNGGSWRHLKKDNQLYIQTKRPVSPKGSTLDIGIAAGPWESVHGTMGAHSTSNGSAFSAAYSDFFEKDGKAHVVVTHTSREDDYRLVVYDKNDIPYPTGKGSSSSVGAMRQTEFAVEGEVSASDLLYVDLQARPYEWKSISGIAMRPSEPVAEVKAEVSTIQAVAWTAIVDLSLASALPDFMKEIERSNSPYLLYRGSREDFWRVWKRNASLANVLAVEPECQWLGEIHEIGHDFFLNDAVQFPVEERLERIAHFSVSQTYHWEPDGDHANLRFSGSASANLAHMGVRAAGVPDATVSGELAFDGTLKAGELLVYMAPMGRHLEFTPMQLIVVEAVSVPTKDAPNVRAMSDTRLWLSAGMPGLLQEVETASAWEQLALTTPTDGPVQQTTWTSAGDFNFDPKELHTLPLLNIVAVGRPMDWPHCWWDLAGHPVRGNPAWQDSLAGENALAIVYTLDSTQSVDLTLRGANMETGGLGGRWSSDYNENERLLYVSERDFANYVSAGGAVDLVARTGVGPWSEIGVIHAGETLELDGGRFRIDEVKPERARQSRLFRPDLPGKVSVRGRYDFDPEWEIVVVGVDSAGNRSPVNFEFGSGLSTRQVNRLLAQHVEMAFEEIDHLVLLKRPVAYYVISNIPTRPGAGFESILPTKRADADFLPNQFAPLPRGPAEDVALPTTGGATVPLQEGISEEGAANEDESAALERLRPSDDSISPAAQEDTSSNVAVLDRAEAESLTKTIPTASPETAEKLEVQANVEQTNADSNDLPYSMFNRDYFSTLLDDPNLLTHIAGDAITPPAADISWGPVVNGLQAAVRFKPEKAEYALGETIGMEFLVRNAGPIPLEFLTSKWRNGDQCFVTDDQGKKRAGGTSQGTGLNRVRRVKLAPGGVGSIESASFTIMPEASGRSPLHPVATWASSHAGIHKVQFRIHFPDSHMSSGELAPKPGDWTGTLTTGERIIEFVDDPELFRAHSVFQIRMAAPKPGDKGAKAFSWEASNRPPDEVDKLWLLDEVLVGDGDLAAVVLVPGASPHQYAIEIGLNEKASEQLALATGENIGHRMACMYQEMIFATPTLNGPLGDGKFVVGGKFSKDVAESIVSEIRAANALDTKAPFMQARTAQALGPEVEVTVRHAGENCMIDFDTGKLFTPLDFNGTVDAFAWMAKNGIDAGGGNQDEVRGLIGMDLVLNPEANTIWEAAATNGALNHDAFKYGKPGNPVYMSAKGELPATWTFKTREGGLGIVQILGFEDEEPRGVRIRYRMME